MVPGFAAAKVTEERYIQKNLMDYIDKELMRNK